MFDVRVCYSSGIRFLCDNLITFLWRRDRCYLSMGQSNIDFMTSALLITYFDKVTYKKKIILLLQLMQDVCEL